MRHRTTLLALAVIVLVCLSIFPSFVASLFLLSSGAVAGWITLAFLLLALFAAIFLVLPRFTSRR
jgi:hypothetical protein